MIIIGRSAAYLNGQSALTYKWVGINGFAFLIGQCVRKQLCN